MYSWKHLFKELPLRLCWGNRPQWSSVLRNLSLNVSRRRCWNRSVARPHSTKSFNYRTVDNYWIVSYCPKPSIMFQCHLNVELCVSRIEIIIYLFKYVCKCSDRATIEIVRGDQRRDETGHSQDARYVSASEAVWKLFQFEIIFKQLTVVRLDVHLENHHTEHFREEQQQQAVDRSRTGTKITERFAASRKWPSASNIKYSNFPCFFTWNRSFKCWKPGAKLRLKQLELSGNLTKKEEQRVTTTLLKRVRTWLDAYTQSVSERRSGTTY